MQLLFAFAEAFGDHVVVGPIGTLEIVDNEDKVDAGECDVGHLQDVQQALDPEHDQVHQRVDDPKNKTKITI